MDGALNKDLNRVVVKSYKQFTAAFQRQIQAWQVPQQPSGDATAGDSVAGTA